MAKNIESIDQEIDIINRIILHGILHWADPGGTYDSNEEKLISTINDWIKYKCLENEYCVSKIDIEFKDFINSPFLSFKKLFSLDFKILDFIKLDLTKEYLTTNSS